ncbi:hypothetical protein L798_12446 [Zootermopsis nevadensis]|uniref:Uncharacterized protein n=1 Tax=Zootermopsis nevadensis TaxID=136037 RepID=A0A067R351_ZOONE|nr:hypothetical protein L798_12446 [Zootermopsis nevadensis]
MSCPPYPQPVSAALPWACSVDHLWSSSFSIRVLCCLRSFHVNGKGYLTDDANCWRRAVVVAHPERARIAGSLNSVKLSPAPRLTRVTRCSSLGKPRPPSPLPQ